MHIKKIVIILYANFGLIYGGNAQKLDIKVKENLKDYALCSCLIEGYKRDSIDLKDVSIPVLYEVTDYSIALSQRKQIDSLTVIVLNDVKPLQSGDYGNKKAVVFNCIQYYKSKKLRQLINSMKKE